MATRNLVPLQIDVGIDPASGFAQYPNFNLISSLIRKGMDWAKYLDVHGGGMHYDKTSGHKEDSVDSPYGHQTCCICVPQDFATEALSLFPDKVKAITPTEFEIFHDVKAHAHEPNEKIDQNILSGLSVLRELQVITGQETTEIDIKIVKALDPLDSTEPGVMINKKKRWAEAMKESAISLKKSV